MYLYTQLPWECACQFRSSTASNIHKWVSMEFCNRKQFESLIGLLHMLARIVVQPGRTFSKRLIDAMESFNHRRGNVPQQTGQVRCYVVALLQRAVEWSVHDGRLQDIPPRYLTHVRSIKELLPIVMASAIWHNKSVRRLCDYFAVVHIFNLGTSSRNCGTRDTGSDSGTVPDVSGQLAPMS